jgi:hypothetical protein
MGINAGVSLSTLPDSRSAGKEVAKEAMGGLSGKPKLAILAIDHLTRKKYKYDEVINGIRNEIGPDVPLIGSTSNGMLVNGRFALKSVGLMLLGGDIDVNAAFNFGKSRIEYPKIADEITKIKAGIANKTNQAMLMFQDGIKFPPEILEQQKILNMKLAATLSGIVKTMFKSKLNNFWKEGKGMPSTQELIAELYNKGWNIPIIGNIASNLGDYTSAEFFGNKSYEDAVNGAIISSTGDSKFGFGYAAGAEATGLTCKLSKKIGNFLLRIDNKPALEGFTDATHLDPESLNELQNQGYVNYWHMLGTREKVGNREYIHLTGTLTDPNLPNLIVTGYPFSKVPEVCEFFRSDTKILLRTTEEALKEAMQVVKKPKFLLGIDCVFRISAYQENLPLYVQKIKDTIGSDIPTFIIGSGGEIFGTKKDDFYMNNFTFLTFMGGT